MMKYDHQTIEKRWQQRWLKDKVFSVPNGPTTYLGRRGVYVLDMFPYPSGDGLHVGHPEGYTASDIVSRYLRMKGKNVLHPMGWDAFGLPAENAAIKKGVHPAIVTEQNVKNFKRQIQSLGFSYDWSREINTTDPGYYKWTQWIFLQLFRKGLAYEAELPIWWCPKDKTGLANEEVVNGCCERCGTPVEKKMLRQWVLKITAYAERLLKGLDKLDWPESIKTLQRNWIGRSEGAEVRFRIKVEGLKIKDEEVAVFTTRPDTLFGATYLVLSPEHPLVDVITTKEHKKKVEGYKIKVLSKSDLERTALEKEKTGVFTGAYAINPVNNEKIPVWIADYVLMSYGTGAIMAVPAHDERDFAFAKKYDLPIRTVIEPITGEPKDQEEFRRSIVAIVQDPKTKKILTINWGLKHGGMLFIGGGREEDEDPVECAKREIAEETGYTDVEFIDQSESIHHHYFAHSKNVARNIEAIGLFFELKSRKQNKQSLEKDEQGKFKVEWQTVAEADQNVRDALHRYVFEKFIKGACYAGEGVMTNSGRFNGLRTQEMRKKIVHSLGYEKSPNIIVVHGCPDLEEARDPRKRTYNKHWMPWLRSSLEKLGVDVETPLMPTPWAPKYEEWKESFEKLGINENTILIGHSCGSTFLVRWLGETGEKVRALILVAPWKDSSHENLTKRNFDTYEIDKTISSRVSSVTIFSSDNEDPEGKEFARQFHESLGGELLLLSGRGHFTRKDMGTEEFPELLEKVSSMLDQGVKACSTVQYKLRDWVFSRQRYWGEPIPLVKCESCKIKVEGTKWVLNFYEKPWHALQTGEKTVETRALNPDEPDRYFGDVKEGDVIKCVLKDTTEVMYLRVVKCHAVKNLEELHERKNLLSKLRRNFNPTLSELKEFYALTPDYVDRIQKNGLVAWEIEHVIPGVVPWEELPLTLPDVEKYEPTGTGESPLAAIDEWVNVKCPHCGGPAKRETNTMPQWAGSCWYYIRFCDPHNDEAMASPEAIKAWLPVDLYVGGAEHAVLHLLYARFWHMVLYDVGAIPPECGDEPFMKLKNQGLILGPDGEKMSKSRGNVINPDDIIEKYGADTLRMYEMFMGPFEDAKPWSAESIVGVRRFLERGWLIGNSLIGELGNEKNMPNRVHRYVRSVTEGIEQFRFNTCVSDFMKWSNEWKDGTSRAEFETFLRLLAPFAPHIAEELWSRLGHDTLLVLEKWPEFDPKKVKEETVTIAVQVMGKLRGTITVSLGASQAEVEGLAKAEPNVAKYLKSEPKKVIFVKDKLINFVV